MRVLELESVGLTLQRKGEALPILRGVSLTLAAGEALALVGESGSGKSMTLRSIVGMIPSSAQLSGRMTFAGDGIGGMAPKARQRFLSRHVAMIFQDPRAHMNPMRTIGDFLCEGLVTVQGVKRSDAERRAERSLEDVGIRDAGRRLRQMPHELSGGMLQRVMIAAALLVRPDVILADEPTTALDVTTQAEVMAILDEQRRERGLAMIFVSHDLDLAAAVCDRLVVMYAGGIVEQLPASQLQEAARHPYTRALLASRPELGRPDKVLLSVPGNPASAFEVRADACAFADRCSRVLDHCWTTRPSLVTIGQESMAACFNPEPSAVTGHV